MTNHVHFVAVPDEVESLARTFGEANRLYTRMKNFSQNVRGYLFQGRFGSCVLDEAHLIAAARYIDQNPVRAGMVENAWDYEWSSAKFHMGIRTIDILVADRTLMGLVHNWQELLAEQDTNANAVLRAGSKIGRPMGSDGFLESIEHLTGRNLRKGRAGRPKKKGRRGRL
ncbi:hypothetical protein GMLC_05540 [Geomonas limicola]|uniref:Transposase IS200-like domain-containing protein n=2 Tax=Geomonas limicola TaxID=2740186 RepID=A0A6V8N344_9BACT|nr:hypothetical protein GMLC_05540 [Geomonas limicola]